MKKKLYFLNVCVFSLLAMNSIGLLPIEEVPPVDKDELAIPADKSPKSDARRAQDENAGQSSQAPDPSKASTPESTLAKFWGGIRKYWYAGVAFVAASIGVLAMRLRRSSASKTRPPAAVPVAQPQPPAPVSAGARQDVMPDVALVKVGVERQVDVSSPADAAVVKADAAVVKAVAAVVKAVAAGRNVLEEATPYSRVIGEITMVSPCRSSDKRVFLHQPPSLIDEGLTLGRYTIAETVTDNDKKRMRIQLLATMESLLSRDTAVLGYFRGVWFMEAGAYNSKKLILSDENRLELEKIIALQADGKTMPVQYDGTVNEDSFVKAFIVLNRLLNQYPSQAPVSVGNVQEQAGPGTLLGVRDLNIDVTREQLLEKIKEEMEILSDKLRAPAAQPQPPALVPVGAPSAEALPRLGRFGDPAVDGHPIIVSHALSADKSAGSLAAAKASAQADAAQPQPPAPGHGLPRPPEPLITIQSVKKDLAGLKIQLDETKPEVNCFSSVTKDMIRVFNMTNGRLQKLTTLETDDERSFKNALMIGTYASKIFEASKKFKDIPKTDPGAVNLQESVKILSTLWKEFNTRLALRSREDASPQDAFGQHFEDINQIFNQAIDIFKRTELGWDKSLEGLLKNLKAIESSLLAMPEGQANCPLGE